MTSANGDTEQRQRNIRERGGSLQVRVYAGVDPVTGKPRYLAKTIKGTDRAAWRRAVIKHWAGSAWEAAAGRWCSSHGSPQRSRGEGWRDEPVFGPPILYADVARPEPITVRWSAFAQSLSARPVKAMLTGPVTIRGLVRGSGLGEIVQVPTFVGHGLLGVEHGFSSCAGHGRVQRDHAKGSRRGLRDHPVRHTTALTHPRWAPK